VPKDRPTILQIVPRLDAGGAERTVVEVSAAIVRGGGRALVLTEGGRLAADVEAAGGEVVPFPAATKNPLRLLANAAAIARMVAAEQVDLIHARSRAPAWSALLAARRTRVPFVTTYHGAYSETNAAKRAYNSVMARGDIVIANSRYTRDLIVARYDTVPERIAVIHRGVDAAAFDPAAIAPERAAALRRDWGVAAHVRIVLQAARLTRWKGQAVLLDAAARLQRLDALGDAVVVLAGDAQGRDAYAAGIQAQAARLCLDRHVRVVGHVDDIAAAYLAAHVTVVASTEPEAFGRAAIEAAAAGCPVIATDIGAPPETVLAQPHVGRPETTGWLVPPGNVEALAAGLAEALALSTAARAEIGARGRSHVLAHFTVEAMQRRTLSVYDRLLGTTLEKRYGSGTLRDNSVTERPQRS
jgi:glycosyltransferase involved in cell wall biosynthesis